MNRANPEPTDSVFEQASDWMFRLQGAAGDAQTDAQAQADLERWLAADPRHAVAWRLARQAWAGTGAIGPLPASTPSPTSAPLASLAERRASRRPRKRLAALALAAGLAGVAVLPSLPTWLEADHATAAGQTETMTLPDGSRVVLAGGSAVSSRFTADGRAVTLLQGEAFFAVTADRARPFTVRAGGVTVTVTGTAFDVAVTDRAASVAVAEGAVTVAHGGGEERLTPGQSVVIDRATAQVHRRAVDPADVAAWRQGRLVAGDQPLSSVVEAIRRQHSGFILLTDSALGDKRVTGIYDIGDPERALRALVRPYGGNVRRVTPYLLVVSPS